MKRARRATAGAAAGARLTRRLCGGGDARAHAHCVCALNPGAARRGACGPDVQIIV